MLFVGAFMTGVGSVATFTSLKRAKNLSMESSASASKKACAVFDDFPFVGSGEDGVMTASSLLAVVLLPAFIRSFQRWKSS